jgi:hypothetical protein
MTTTIDLTTDIPTITRSADALGRTLHLVDIENLSGGPQRTLEEHLHAYRAYVRRAEVGHDDQIVVAACGKVMRSLAFELPSGILQRTANGSDGADRALLAHDTPERIALRFERLVIGSGDHAFVDLALAVQAMGVTVVVVSGRGFRSAEFGGHGFGVRNLDLGTSDDMALIA